MVADPRTSAVADDRNALEPGDRVVFIVEQDGDRASLLLSAARAAACKGVVIADGGSVMTLAQRFKPAAIILDTSLPDMDGLALLDLLKRTPETRHLPVHLISADERNRVGLSMGACSISDMPVQTDAFHEVIDRLVSLGRKSRKLLRIAAARSQHSLAELLGNGDLAIDSVATVADARRLLSSQHFDCVVLDLAEQPDRIDLQDLETLPWDIPLIVHAPAPSPDAEVALAPLAERACIVRSKAGLADAAALMLHRPLEKLPQETQALLQQQRCDPLLAARKIMVVDDDIRNIFSLVSALEERGVQPLYAETGRAAIDLLRRRPVIDAVLVDIMMPGMDGCETIREIRAIPGYASLPIVAVTARAMKGDRQKCIEAGATDYIAKPVDMEQIVSVLRICLRRSERLPSAGVATHNVVVFPIAG
jgi:CheY-like chemotaxis protein